MYIYDASLISFDKYLEEFEETNCRKSENGDSIKEIIFTTSMINKEEKIQNIFQMMKDWKYSIFSKIDISCLK